MKSIRRFVIVLLAIGLFLAACGGGDEEPETEQQPVATDAPEEEPEPTDEPEPEPEPTDEPADEPEPEPTNEPEPEPELTDEPVEELEPTPEPEVGNNVPANFELFESSEEGISISYPSDWFSDSTFFNVFASAEELLDSPDPGEEGGVALVFGGSATDMGTSDPIEALNMASQDFELGEGTEFTSGPTATTINGQDAAIATISTTTENGTPLSAIFAVAMNGEQAAVFIGVTPAETESEYFPTFEAMLDTLVVSEPEIVDEPTDTSDLSETAGSLLYGESVDGVVVSSESVIYSFIGLEGEVVDIVVEPDENLDVILDVVDVNGSSIIGGAIDNSFGTETAMAVTLASSGDFYIVLTGFDVSAGNFTLTLAETGTTVAGSAFPTSGGLGFGDVAQSSVPSDGTAAWSFTASAGDVLNIVVTPLDDELDVVVDVVDAAGDSILDSGEVDASFGEEQISGHVVTADGSYMVIVRGFAGSGGNFELSLDSSSSGAIPAGDTIAYGDIILGTISGSDEVVSYVFLGNEGEFIDVTVNSVVENFDLVVDVLDGAGSSILEDGAVDLSFDTEFVRTVRLPESGAFSIAVSGFDGSTGEYEVNLDLSNSGEYNTVLYAFYTLDTADDTHIFPFTSPAGDTVTVIVRSDSIDLDVIVDVYDDATGEIIDSVDNRVLFEEYTFVVPDSGDYYFLVRGYEGSIGDYEITLVGSEQTEFVLAVNDTIDGRFDESSGVIEYWFGATAGETILFTMHPDEEIDGVIRILDQDGNVLAEVDNGLFGESEELTYTFETDAFYIIEVSDFFEGQGEFLFYIDEG